MASPVAMPFAGTKIVCGLVHIWAENSEADRATARAVVGRSATDSITTLLTPLVSVNSAFFVIEFSSCEP